MVCHVPAGFFYKFSKKIKHNFQATKIKKKKSNKKKIP